MNLTLCCCILACCVVSVTSQSSRTCPISLRKGVCRPRYPRCLGGTTCIGRYCCGKVNTCPAGMIQGRRCSMWGRRCPLDYSCIRNTCCRRRVTIPPLCPNGQRATRRCSILTGMCPTGHTCTKGWCCRAPTCPKGWYQGPSCENTDDCKPGYTCRSDTCCKPRFIVPAICPKGQIRVGVCPNCPRLSTCFKGICCRRKIIIHPGVLCPKVYPDMKCESVHDDQCDTDADCAPKGRCCEDPCGGRKCYYPPVIGKCPALPAGTVGVCSEACNDCIPKGQLCCSNGCGNVCKDPVNPVKPVQPVCPPIQSPIDLTACPTGTSCEGDEDCHKGHKCCDNGQCGSKICKKPMFPILEPSTDDSDI